MYKRFIGTGILMAVVLMAGARKTGGDDKNAGPAEKLHFDTDKPQAGQTISFDYSAAGGKLAGAKDIHAALFYYTANTANGFYAQDVTIRGEGKENWKGNFLVPDSAVAFAIRLKSGKLIADNNGRGYISLVYKDGTVRPGAYAGVAILYSNGESLLNLPNRADTAIALLEKEFSAHPDLKPKYESSFYYNLASLKKQDAYPLLDKRAQDVLSAPDVTLADYKLAVKLYQLQRKKKGVDSLLAIVARKFPASDLAVQHDENQFYAIKDLDSLELFYAAFQEKHPQAGPKDPASQTAAYFASSLAQKYIGKKEYRKAIGYASQMYDGMADYRGYMYSWVALELLKKDSALSLADSLIRAALTGVEVELAHPELFRRQSAPFSDWKEEISLYYTAAFTDTYGKILIRKGENARALEVQQKAVDLAKGENNGYNERLVSYLAKAGDAKKARTQSEEFIKTGAASDSVKIWFKEAYIKEKGSDKGYAVYLGSLETVAVIKFREKAQKEKLDLPAKAFDIPSLDGKEVSLASLQGKVVILDFWATWCGPCKASFPAMQTTVDKYKNDTNVVFLFVDTYESLTPEERISQVKKFIQDNKYSFTVLLDKMIDQEKRLYSVVGDYGVGGIPTKFIIGPQGKIAFKAVGFDGNNEKLVTELSVYIEIAKGG
ncbi:TlpA family protein disulfide reductase [Flavitalea flava]